MSCELLQPTRHLDNMDIMVEESFFLSDLNLAGEKCMYYPRVVGVVPPNMAGGGGGGWTRYYETVSTF